MRHAFFAGDRRIGIRSGAEPAPGPSEVLLDVFGTPAHALRLSHRVRPRSIRRKDFFIARSFYFPLSEVPDNIAILRHDSNRYGILVDSSGPLDALPELFERFAAGELLKPVCAP